MTDSQNTIEMKGQRRPLFAPEIKKGVPELTFCSKGKKEKKGPIVLAFGSKRGKRRMRYPPPDDQGGSFFIYRHYAGGGWKNSDMSSALSVSSSKTDIRKRRVVKSLYFFGKVTEKKRKGSGADPFRV